MHTNSLRFRFGAAYFALALLFLLLALWPLPTGKVAATGAPLELWRITPRAPVISERDRLAELQTRRQEVLKRLGNNAVLVLFSTEPRVYAFDVDYHYRQENNLYYLTGIKQEGATLVLIPGAKKTREILFMPERDAWRETWNGLMLSQEQARARSGIQEIWDSKLLNAFLATLAPRAEQTLAKRGAAAKPNEAQTAQWQEDFQPLIDAVKADQAELYLLAPAQARDLREYRREFEFAESLKAAAAGFKIKQAFPIFAELRLRKSAWETQLVQHAADITAEAFHRVFAAVAPAMYEYEIQAEFEYTFRRRGADSWGYPCIVGGGPNAAILHYNTNQERLDDNTLLLMDCAAEFDHYTADITRTIPINGKFSKEQADIYRVVYEAQEECFKLIAKHREQKVTVAMVNARAREVVADGLLRLGLITSKNGDEARTWFMHGTSHWLGMNVHDVGDYNTPLAPGMIFTVEPGIYLRPDALDVMPKTSQNEKFAAAIRAAFEKYKGIGVRIEDDILITPDGYRNMSQSIPRKLEEVETTMAKLKRELKQSGWPSVAAR